MRNSDFLHFSLFRKQKKDAAEEEGVAATVKCNFKQRDERTRRSDSHPPGVCACVCAREPIFEVAGRSICLAAR